MPFHNNINSNIEKKKYFYEGNFLDDFWKSISIIAVILK